MSIFLLVCLGVVFSAALITGIAIGIKILWGAVTRWCHKQEWWTGY